MADLIIMVNKTEKEFIEKFVEVAPDGSNWGAGLRIRHTGTTEDRKILDDIMGFWKKAIFDIVSQIKDEIVPRVEVNQ